MTRNRTLHYLNLISMFAAIALVLASPAYGQFVEKIPVVGIEAYLYGDVPVPPHLIADYYIERVLLPELQPELAPLWLEVKDAAQPMDEGIDAYFSSHRVSVPGTDLRQTYLRTLLLLKQLRNALIIFEQISITPDSWAALQHAWRTDAELTDYLLKAATFVAGGDNPQKAALKAVIAWEHERHRRLRLAGSIKECYFENPQTETHWLCVNRMRVIDSWFRGVRMAEMFPIDAQAREQLAAQYGNVTEEMLRTGIIHFIIKLLLTGGSPPESRKDQLRRFHAEKFRSYRESAILSALEHREEYRAVLLQRESEIELTKRVTAENGPLSVFLSVITAGMVGLFMIDDMNVSARASANANNPKWVGHENDEWCYREYVTYSSGRIQMNTYCEAYDGTVRSIPGQDGSLVDALGDLVNPDHCAGVKGWCKP